MITKLNNSLTVDIIDRFGKLVDTRDYVNIAYPEISSAPVAIIDWSTVKDQKVSVADILSPIVHNNVEFHGNYGWGSAVKRGQTLGLTFDIGNGLGFVKSTEDGQRVQRWLFAQGINGGFKSDVLRVKIIQPGHSFMGHLCEDGFGYISSRYSEFISGDKVSLGKARETYSFWQRLEFTQELWDEFAGRVDDLVHDLSNPTSMLMDYSHSSFSEKKALAALDVEMVEHPFVANALARTCADMYFRSSTTLPAKGVFRVAAPTEFPTAVFPGHNGKIALARYPIDSNSSIQAIDLSVSKDEQDRIANLEIIQYSIHSDQLFAKGCLGIVDDLGEYDLVLCSEDIKMGMDDVKDLRRLSEIDLTHVIMPFTTVFDKGSACGVNAKWAKDLLGLDHDGDMPVLIDANELPVFWQTVKNLKPGKTPKLPKSKTPITDVSRAEMIFKSMSNLVGFASNVASMSFVVKDREALAERIGFKSEQSLNDELNYFIKCGTDGFKTSIDLVKVEKQVAVLQNNLQRVIGGAPWCLWSNHPEAFRRFVPPFAYANENGRYCYENGDPMPPEMAKLAVKDYMDGTIGQIVARILPSVQQLLDTPIKTQPLTYFRRWAFDVSEEVYKSASAIVDFHNARVRRVNWYDPESIASYKLVLKREVEVWMEREHIDRKTAACALWLKTHSSRSLDSGASAVFLAFPEEAKWIIETKPGLVSGANTVITGLNFQLPGIDNLNIDVEVVNVQVVTNNKTLIRKAVVAIVPGQKQPGPVYPRNMIGMVALNTDQPECGKYHAVIKQVSSAAWNCQLV